MMKRVKKIGLPFFSGAGVVVSVAGGWLPQLTVGSGVAVAGTRVAVGGSEPTQLSQVVT